jgi:hypothetical protein
MSAPYDGTSTDRNVPGIVGNNTDGVGVHGESKTSTAVSGVSDTGIAVHGISQNGVWGIRGEAANGTGVHGESRTKSGVGGVSEGGFGVHGVSKNAEGVFGESETGRAIVGVAKTATGIEGNSTSGAGVFGSSVSGIGVHGISENQPGLRADSKMGAALIANSQAGEAIHAESNSPNLGAIAVFHRNRAGVGAAIFAVKEGDVGHAGVFKGNVIVEGNLEVTKDIVLTNADCAEDFDIAEVASTEPGTVMVLDEKEGLLHHSCKAYDRRVAGVISGAGNYKPGIVLDKVTTNQKRRPIALLGKVFCKVDAQYGSIEIGDLLTTSDTPGHAMKAQDPSRAFGAVIGKALRSLREGRDLIPILIALQ